MIALPQALDAVSSEDLSVPGPWEKLNTRGSLTHLAVTHNGGRWAQGYQELYYYPPQDPGALMWTPQQILDRSFFVEVMSHHQRVYVLGSEKAQRQCRIAYIEDPNAEWQRIDVPETDQETRLLFVDHQNNLWIAQGKQVWVYDFQHHAWTLKFETDYPVYAAAEDAQHDVWVGTVNRLVLWHNNQLVEQGSFQAGSISAIYPEQGELGISTSEGFHLYDPASRQAQHFLTKQKVTGAGRTNEDWVVATEKEGLYLLSPAGKLSDKPSGKSSAYRVLPWNYAQGLPGGQVKAMAMNTDTLAVLLEDTGFLAMPTSKLKAAFEGLPQVPALASAVYESACEIPEPLLSRDSVPGRPVSGVLRRLVKDRQVTFFGKKSVCPYPGTFVYADAVYAFDTESLYTQRNHEIRPIPLPVKSYLSPVDMYRTDSLAYFSFPNKGVFRYDVNAKPAWRQVDLDGEFFFAGRRMARDFFAIKRYRSQDNLYHTHDGEHFESVALPETLRSAFIYAAAFAPDGQGPLVLASSQGLVFVSQPEQKNSVIQQMGKESGLPSAFVQQIVVTAEGNVWMTLYKNGLAYYELRTEKVYTWSTREGLISQFIDELTVDDRYVWLQSHDGRVASYKITDLLKNHAKIQKNTTRNAGS